jgi:Arc/MetJ family transcription regulator
MRTTVEIDDQLLQEAMATTGTKKKRQLIELALHEVYQLPITGGRVGPQRPGRL